MDKKIITAGLQWYYGNDVQIRPTQLKASIDYRITWDVRFPDLATFLEEPPLSPYLEMF